MDCFDKEEFEPVKWKDVRQGYTIYLQGTQQGRFYAYGPHIVVSETEKQLENPRTHARYLHYAEELLRGVETEGG